MTWSDGTCLAVYTVDADPAPLALVIGGRRRGSRAPSSCRRDRCDGRGPTDGPRKILLVTTDQQRYDTLGLQRRHARPDPGGGPAGRRGHPVRAGPPPVGGVHAVPVDHPDRPAPEHPRRVDERGAPPLDAPSVAAELHGAGYRTALVGKAHFEPFLDPFFRFEENSMARPGPSPGGLHRGFEHLELATHGVMGPSTTPGG